MLFFIMYGPKWLTVKERSTSSTPTFELINTFTIKFHTSIPVLSKIPMVSLMVENGTSKQWKKLFINFLSEDCTYKSYFQ